MALSLLLLILSGTLGGSWVPMINLISVFFLPVYAVLSRQLAPRAAESPGSYNAAATPPFDEGKAIWGNFGVCFLGLVLASMVAFPLILLHSGTLCVCCRLRRFTERPAARFPFARFPFLTPRTHTHLSSQHHREFRLLDGELRYCVRGRRVCMPLRVHLPPACAHLTSFFFSPTGSSALGFTPALRRRQQTATERWRFRSVFFGGGRL